VTGRQQYGEPRVFRDTSGFMNIDRDDVIELGDERYVVEANEREGRFTIDDQPKFWVKRARSLATGSVHILKLAFDEQFKARIGELEIPCHRSADKESQVLERMAGDLRFMQGHTARDERGNNVRIIDFIRGRDLLRYVEEIELDHESYFATRFPAILAGVIECFRAIAALHVHQLCHGDIRNDHIFVEKETGRFRWIDFDLSQPFPDFDVWSAGNILHSIIGKGFVTFRRVEKSRPDVAPRLSRDDASLFFPHRIMNIGRVYPYVPEDLNRILLRFSIGTEDYYDDMSELVAELCECAARHGWPTTPPDGDTRG
jgi:hypothetical protein